MERPRVTKRPRIVVRGPSDAAAAERLRKAIVSDLATLAVELLNEGRLPTPSVKSCAESE